ncbi:BrnA antitoxin family protein [Hyphomicrobium sp. 99]|uniref:BrnA antitoxin family protein n=1 Tax=Hyphomicrobium sp. 99 TaxID=1163419 RepID=UPI0005F7CD1D|nr:BrnA antitoxin family protein [Hyphomicrobium sp. 99]
MVRKKHIIALRADPNDPEDWDVTQEDLEKALAERRARIGRPAGSDKEQVTLRLDKDVIAKFRATGNGWQTRINAALKRAKV